MRLMPQSHQAVCRSTADFTGNPCVGRRGLHIFSDRRSTQAAVGGFWTCPIFAAGRYVFYETQETRASIARRRTSILRWLQDPALLPDAHPSCDGCTVTARPTCLHHAIAARGPHTLRQTCAHCKAKVLHRAARALGNNIIQSLAFSTCSSAFSSI